MTHVSDSMLMSMVDKLNPYLRQALEWLNREMDHSAWDIETRKIRDEILDISPGLL